VGRGGAPRYTRQRRFEKAAQVAGIAVVAVKPWAPQRGSSHGPNAVGTNGTVVRTGQLTGGPQRFRIFSNLSKTGSTLKIKKGALTCSKNS
jgi:hypothetical protein